MRIACQYRYAELIALSLDISQAAVRTELARQDVFAIANGLDDTIHEHYTVSTVIATGIDIEEQQYVYDIV